MNSLIETETKVRKKRKQRNGEKPENTFTDVKTTKVTLSSLKPNQDFMNNLRPFLIQINQVKVIASWCIKHHIYTAMENQTLDFEINQTYIAKVFNIILQKWEKIQLPYTESLKRSVKWVMEQVQPTLTVSKISKGFSTQVIAYLARSLIVNWKVHVQEHVETVLQCWLNNQIRASMTEEEFNDQRTSIPIYKKRLATLPFYNKYTEYVKRLEDMLKDIQDDKLAKKGEDGIVNKKTFNHLLGLTYMYQLRKDTEVLEALTNRQLKAISVFPQAAFQIGSIRIDTTALACYYKSTHPNCTFSEVQLRSVENQEKLWQEFFDLRHIRKLRPTWSFGWSLITDGTYAAITFERYSPKTDLQKKKKKIGFEQLSAGQYRENDILERFTTKSLSKDIQWISIDPGIRSILTGWKLGEKEEVMTLKQKKYRHESGLNSNLKKTTNRYAKYMSDVKAAITKVPYSKSTNMNRISLYLQCLRLHWNQIWLYYSHKKIRQWKFQVWKKRQSFLDTFLTQDIIKGTSDKKTILLFGAGGAGGQFMKLRSGGFKGPVLGLKRLLAKKYPVITVSEFRTSNRCLDCGTTLLHPNHGKMHGVSFCSETNHHSMLNRDVDAAKKIGYRFFARLFDKPLGPWGQDWEKENQTVFTGLFDFANQTFPGDFISDEGSTRKCCE
jgi:hypothetical protein